MNHLRKGDQVIVITGKDKGRKGTILGFSKNEKVLVESVNMAKKHTKPNPQAGIEGGIVDKEMPLSISNVMLFNPLTDKGDKVGIKVLEDGKRVRYFKSNNEVVDV